MKLTKKWSAVSLTALLLAFAGAAVAQDRIIRIARLGYVEGEVNYQKSTDEKDRWFEATANLPLDARDQLYTGADGRAEVQFTAGNVVRIDHETNIRIVELADLTTRLALPVGQATVCVTNLDPRRLQLIDAASAGSNDPIRVEISTPVIAVTLLREGSYRISVMEDGTTEVTVRRGEAEIFNRDIGSIRIKEGRRMVVVGDDSSIFRSVKLPDKDEWDLWNEERDAQLLALGGSTSSRYVPAYIPGVSDLDQHGSWIDSPEYGWVWSPSGVGSDWAPYRHGCWRWYPSYGWAWIGHEPWGWVPYHYGRWAYFSNRWCWVPFGVGNAYRSNWSWSPSLVVFFGRRGYDAGYREGFRDGVRVGNRNAFEWIGWVPLAPGERADIVAPREPVTIAGGLARSASGDFEALKNSKAPGGISGVEGREFERSRVIVHGVTTPPRRADQEASQVAFERVSNGIVAPAEADTPRFVRPARTSSGRDLDAPVITRVPMTQTRGTSRQSDNGASANDDNHQKGIERSNRNVEFKPAERIAAPPSRSLSSPSAPTSNSGNAPRRDVQRDAGRDAPQIRIEAPPPRRTERSDNHDSTSRPERPQRSEQQQPQRQQQQQSSPPPPHREQSVSPPSAPAKVEAPPTRSSESKQESKPESKPAPERPQQRKNQ